MFSYEEKKDAFDAYNNSRMTDKQLKICADSMKDLLDTMRAMNLSGPPMVGFYLMQSSIDGIIDSRKWDKKWSED